MVHYSYRQKQKSKKEREVAQQRSIAAREAFLDNLQLQLHLLALPAADRQKVLGLLRAIPGEKDAKLAQKLDQLQPSISVFPL